MVRLHCEDATKYLVPAVRAILALKLVSDYGLTQVEAARRMRITQAAISYYINLKRGSRAIRLLEEDYDLMDEISRLARRIYEEDVEEEELRAIMCRICRRARERGVLERLVRERKRGT